jgi:F-type H+-transporting ATPase subunit delta
MRRGTPAGARRYARALLDVGVAQGDTTVGQDLEDLARVFAQSAELRAVLLHPTVPAEKKTAIVAALLGHTRGPGPGLIERLLALLVERDRLELLPLIAESYRRLWNAHRGVVEAEAVSARELDESEATAVAEAASRLAGKQADLRRRVDPSLLGGLLLRMEGRVYDGSVRTRLRSLRERLAGTEAL